jgi:hypothetical protein
LYSPTCMNCIGLSERSGKSSYLSAFLHCAFFTTILPLRMHCIAIVDQIFWNWNICQDPSHPKWNLGCCGIGSWYPGCPWSTRFSRWFKAVLVRYNSQIDILCPIRSSPSCTALHSAYVTCL